MHILKKIWEDIQQGENIDLYITVVIAIGLSILNLLGAAPATWIGPITLAVLGLIAISTLGSRYRIEKLIEEVSQKGKGFFSDEFPTDYRSNLVSAEEVWLLGVRLSRTIRSNYVTIEEKLKRGHHVKVLLVHPDGAALEMAVGRNYARSGRDVDRESKTIRMNLQLLCELKQTAPDRLEIRTLQTPLTFGAVGINLQTTTGILYLEHYPYRTGSDSLPKFILKSSDGRWYDFFREELYTLWESGVVWDCDDTDETEDD